MNPLNKKIWNSPSIIDLDSKLNEGVKAAAASPEGTYTNAGGFMFMYAPS